jgi:hypothetical protein
MQHTACGFKNVADEDTINRVTGDGKGPVGSRERCEPLE